MPEPVDRLAAVLRPRGIEVVYVANGAAALAWLIEHYEAELALRLCRALMPWWKTRDPAEPPSSSVGPRSSARIRPAMSSTF